MLRKNDMKYMENKNRFEIKFSQILVLFHLCRLHWPDFQIDGIV